MNLWLIIIIAGLATYLIRLSFILIAGQRSIPLFLSRALRLVPPAVLTAIIFPQVFIQSGRLDLSFGNPRILAAVLAGLVAWRTRNVVLTIVSGMLVLWATQGFFQ